MKQITATIVLALCLSSSGSGRCESELPYRDTAKNIENLLRVVSSDVRKEVYGYINFTNCVLNYNVTGFYPVGTPYNKSYSNIDFASLNADKSKIGADSSAYVILYFNKPVNQQDDVVRRTSNIVVFDAASNEHAQTLFKAFLHLGDLCGAEKNQL